MIEDDDEIEIITEEQFQDYLALCKELKTLADDLWTPMILEIDVIYLPFRCTALTDDQWKKIKAANQERLAKKDWKLWQIFPHRRACVRFSGDEDDTAFQDFKKYAERASSIFDRYYDLPVPEGLAWRTPTNIGCNYEDRHLFLLEMVLATDATLARPFGYIAGRNSFDPVAPNNLPVFGLNFDNFFEYAASAVKCWLPPARNIRIVPAQEVKPARISPVVKCVTLKATEQGFQLRAKSLRPFFLSQRCRWIFMALLAAGKKEPGGIVPWEELNRLVHEKKENAKSAGPKLRSVLKRLRTELAAWAQPKDGKDWLLTDRKSKGAYLNTSFQWQFTKETSDELGLGGKSERGIPTDPNKMAQHTRSKGYSA